MEVIKRDGTRQKVSFDKITHRISALCEGLDLKFVDPIKITQETIQGLHDGITTRELDMLSSDICANKIHHHPDYNQLAARILVSNLHKSTEESFLKVVEELASHKIVSPEFRTFVKEHSGILQLLLNFSRDYAFDYFAFKTLERSYLFKIKEGSSWRIVERPQHMWMRVAIQLHGLHSSGTVGEKIAMIQKTYEGLSRLLFTHATPTLFNSGTPRPQLSSCFLMTCEDDLSDIFKSLSDIGAISKFAGGIGITLSKIRSKGSRIRSTNGVSDGIIPLCKVLQSVGRYVNQAGKRNGSIAVYLEPWHGDLMDFIELRKNTGDENLRARDLFLALYINDEFMTRLLNDQQWYLMCPDECPGLVEAVGEDFSLLYNRYVEEGKYKRSLPAKEVWQAVLESQIETGMPYVVYKDHVNRKCNQKNLGTINCSNLCSEITIFSDKNETAVCNLGSICLPRFIRSDGEFDYEALGAITQTLTENLNKVIDVNYYPTENTRRSNERHRPIGIGVQGLADVYMMLGLPFESDKARDVNKRIFETIYFNALRKSCDLAKECGHYSSFKNSPFSQGELQWHLWGLNESDLSLDEREWKRLVNDIKKHGTVNSMLTALMPTASTAQIMGNSECFEPITSNIYSRKTLAGDFIVVNEKLVRELIKRELWSKEMYEKILYYNGSVQSIKEIPQELKEVYKTAFEIKGISIVRQAAERGPFIDHTQSMNIFLATPDFDKLSASHIWGWKNGLKTGMYYLRTQPAVDPIKFGLDALTVNKIRDEEKEESPKACVFRRKGQPIPEGCEVCSA